MPRVRRILQFGESSPFEPFDRFAMHAESKGKTIGELLDTFERLRGANLAQLRSLQLGDRELALRGRHLALGAVTMRQLLATWTVHDLNHIYQIAKAMAFRYRGGVGPWRAYLGILKEFQ